MNVFAYDIPGDKWSTIPTIGDTVTRPAEGSTAVVPDEGTGDNLAFYFSGHLDDHTVENWSNQIPRLYLSSLVEFDLGNHRFTNITEVRTARIPSSSPITAH